MSMSLETWDGEGLASKYLLFYLRVGKQNAITRRELCYRTGLPDRKVRVMIEYARHEGCLILNDQDGKGYYLPDNIEEVERQYKQMTSRALSILHSRKAFRQALIDAGRDIK